MNEPIGRLGSLKPGAGPHHRVGHRLDRLVLPDNALVQMLLEMRKFLDLALHQARDGNAGPSCDDLCDILFVDFFLDQPGSPARRRVARLGLGKFLFQRGERSVLQFGDLVQVVLALGFFDLEPGLLDLRLDGSELFDRALFALPLRLQGVALVAGLGQFLLQPLQPVARGRVGLALESLALDLELHYAAVDLVQLDRHRFLLGAQLGRRLVDQVDRLVGKEAVGDVAFGENRRGHQGGVLDADAVMDLVAFLESAQDGDGVLDARLIDHHRLEAALQRGVFLDMLAVLVERGRADAVELAPRQRRLEQVGRIHRALGRARADHRVQFVDEQDDLAGGLLHFLEHGLEPLLEFAAEFGARDQRAHVERDEAAVLESLGHVAGDDTLGEPLDDGGLAYARLADQHRVVLGAAREHLDHAADFLVAADDRVELARRGHLGEVASVALERLVGRFRIGRSYALVAAHLLQRLHQLVVGHPGLAQDSRGGARLVEHRYQHVLDRDVIVLELARFLLGAREHPAEPLRGVHLARIGSAAGDVRNLGQLVGQLAPHAGAVHAAQLKHGRYEALVVLEQRGEQMLDVDGLIVSAQRRILRAPQRLLELFGKTRWTAHGNWPFSG